MIGSLLNFKVIFFLMKLYIFCVRKEKKSIKKCIEKLLVLKIF